MKNIEKILSFNKKEIPLVFADGEWWIAIKPVCEALKVDYNDQFKNLKSDGILSQVLCQHRTIAADTRLRKMICLPEKYFYGWVFSIRSNSKELLKFRRECYEILRPQPPQNGQ